MECQTKAEQIASKIMDAIYGTETDGATYAAILKIVKENLNG